MLFLILCAASAVRTDNVLAAEAAPKNPCAGVMCQFLSAFQEDLGKISKALEKQVMFIQETSVVTTGKLRKNPVLPKGKVDQAMMAGMVGMLGDMYGKMKERIAKANAAEKSQKAEFDERIKDLDAKKKALADKGIKTDDTYDRIEAYWKKQRANAHRQYHNLLKLTHAGMAKFDGLMKMGKDAEAGKPLDAKKLQEVKAGVPNVVFTELQSVTTWVRHAQAEIANELKRGDA
jgi:hypothetical protein